MKMTAIVVSLAIFGLVPAFIHDTNILTTPPEHTQPHKTITYHNEVVLAGFGTGWFLAANGYIATVAHVGCAPDTTYVTALYKGKEYKATVLFCDSKDDIALIKTNIPNHNYLPVANGREEPVGEATYVLGYAMGNLYDNLPYFSAGYVASEGLWPDYVALNMPVMEGHSGSPVINSRGQVIGLLDNFIEGSDTDYPNASNAVTSHLYLEDLFMYNIQAVLTDKPQVAANSITTSSFSTYGDVYKYLLPNIVQIRMYAIEKVANGASS